MRLTEAQRQLLRDVFSGDDGCSAAYRPAQRLVKLGLCRWRAETRLELTPAGRTALEASNAE